VQTPAKRRRRGRVYLLQIGQHLSIYLTQVGQIFDASIMHVLVVFAIYFFTTSFAFFLPDSVHFLICFGNDMH
jgi:hypothetical protein